MRNEIAAAVLFLVQLIEKNEKFSPDQLECFRCRLIELLTERFRNHWFPDKPFKGQGYRCIRVNGHSRRDSTLESAANAAGVKYEDLSLPVELTLWVDPHEVCCRFGESKGSYCTLASFEKENVSVHYDKENCNKENRPDAGSSKIQKNPTTITLEQPQKPKPLGSSNQNQHHPHHNHHQQQQQQLKQQPEQQQRQQQQKEQEQEQQQQQQTNNGTGRRRNLNSPRPHATRNRSWFNHSFSMGFGPHPMSQSWYNVMPPHFLGGPSPPPFMGYRGSKWIHPSSYPAGFTRFHHWSPKAALKV